jgi:hypothetical protein
MWRWVKATCSASSDWVIILIDPGYLPSNTSGTSSRLLIV